MNIYGLGGLYGWNGGLGYGSLGYNNLSYGNLGYNGLNYSALSAANFNYLSSLYSQGRKENNGCNLNNSLEKSIQTKQDIRDTAQTRKTGVQRNTTTGKTRTQHNLTTRTTGKTSTQHNLANTTEVTYYPSFQSVLAASIKGHDFTELLTAQYPGAKCQVMDTTKINDSLWQRNDYPFEKFFDEKIDTSILDWKPTTKEPSMTDANVQARLNAARGKHVVIIPPELEEKLEQNTELAQNILYKISTLMQQQDTVPRTINSFTIALDKDGNIANYRFSGGGQLMLPYCTTLQNNTFQKTANIGISKHQEHIHYL